MVKTKEELIGDIRTFIGEEPTDDALSILENVTDSFDDLETKANDTTDWKSKYEENDREWRKKYTERFNSPSKDDDEDDGNDGSDEVTMMTSYDELFIRK